MPSVAGPQLANPQCATPKRHNDIVRHVLRFSSRGGDYRASTISRSQLERLGEMRACAKRLDRAAYKRMRGFWDRRSDRWAFHRHIDIITPYGEWAVPPHIVARESGGSYTARNPTSTAGGAYQQLDSTFHSVGGTDYPGTHDASQAPPWEQHVTAARLWNGGAGASHWALTY
jgi:hypothetical protein